MLQRRVCRKPPPTMARLTTLTDVLVHELKDLYSAETQLLKALPRMARAASSPALRDAFEAHLEETRLHVERLDQAAEFLDASPRGKSCKAMKGLIEEGGEAMEEKGTPQLLDIALIIAAQKVEHYEIAGYGSAAALARQGDHPKVAALLEATLEEEDAADRKLTALAESIFRTKANTTAG